MYALESFIPWHPSEPAALHRGGTFRVPRESAPLGIDGRRLEAAAVLGGSCPPELRGGCRLDLSDDRVGTFLLTLPIAVRLAELLSESTGTTFALRYSGQFSRLTDRLRLDVLPAHGGQDEHFIDIIPSEGASRRPRLMVRFSEIPTLDGQPLLPRPNSPYLLNHISAVLWPEDDVCVVSASLPARYCAYLSGLFRAKFEPPPFQHFRSEVQRTPDHVVCVATTARPEFKDWGRPNFVELGTRMRQEHSELRMTIVAPPGTDWTNDGHDWLAVSTAPLNECVDLFASAALVIGNDTGLTHLAALTQDRDGRAPQVIGLYNMHSFLKWSTGAENHHALALPFAQMLAAADADVLLNQIKPELWGEITDLQGLPVDCVESAAVVFLAEV